MTNQATAALDEPLAINGGPKAVPDLLAAPEPKIGMEEFLAIAQRFGFSVDAIERIKEAVSNNDFLGGGPNLAGNFCAEPAPPAGEQYEALVRSSFGVPYALAVSSGTAALHSAFVAVGVGPGTEVIVPATGFLATSMAVALAGGIPVFCDVDESLTLDPNKIEALVTDRTVALAPTHVWGNVCNMDPIMAIAQRRRLKVVEDCAQSPGARYRGRYAGTIGDVGCYSISAYKIIGGSESGLAVTGDERLYDRMCQLAEGGGLRRPVRCAPPRYEGELFVGTNYRLSELEAAVNLAQFRKLARYCAGYHRVSRSILGRLRTYREVTPQILNDNQGYIGYLLRFFPETGELSAGIAEALRAEGIAANHRGGGHAPDYHLARDMFPVTLKVGPIPGGSVFDDPRNADSRERGGYRRAQCPVSEDLFAREVSVGLNHWYSEEDCEHIAKGIDKVLAAFCTPDPKGKAWI